MSRILLVLVAFLVACASAKESESPKEFINRFRDKDLGILFNVVIEARNKRDGRFHYYYSHVIQRTDTLTLPSFEYFDDLIKEDSTYLNDVYKFGESNNVEKELSLKYAKNFAQELDLVYQELGVINSVSNPSLGSFIKFKLNEKCNVFYLNGPTTLTPQWREHLSKINKVDEKWYYECK